jgi:hypothetical protein
MFNSGITMITKETMEMYWFAYYKEVGKWHADYNGLDMPGAIGVSPSYHTFNADFAYSVGLINEDERLLAIGRYQEKCEAAYQMILSNAHVFDVT